jgi:hypothetical protein
MAEVPAPEPPAPAPIGAGEEPRLGPHGEIHPDRRTRTAAVGVLSLWVFLVVLVVIFSSLKPPQPPVGGGPPPKPHPPAHTLPR